MSNSYFRFKQFTVLQDKCAMKVSTDACLFGAYIASKEQNCGNEKTNMLDIGAGTGLLALMIAQQVKGQIDAVEIDEKAYGQIKENFQMSQWAPRLSAYLSDVTKMDFDKKYDIIVSNPPFFKNSLKSSDLHKNLAKHSTSLPHATLAEIVSDNLANEGTFYVLLPVEEFVIFEKIAIKINLFPTEIVNIRHYPHSNNSRTIGIFSNVKTSPAAKANITIKGDKDTYSPEFIKLLKDYYLYL